MEPFLAARLALLIGIFAAGTALGDFLKDSDVNLIHQFGRALKLATGLATGIFTALIATRAKAFGTLDWSGVYVLVGMVLGAAVILTPLAARGPWKSKGRT